MWEGAGLVDQTVARSWGRRWLAMETAYRVVPYLADIETGPTDMRAGPVGPETDSPFRLGQKKEVSAQRFGQQALGGAVPRES